jgi:hypothetical protein
LCVIPKIGEELAARCAIIIKGFDPQVKHGLFFLWLERSIVDQVSKFPNSPYAAPDEPPERKRSPQLNS